MKGIPTYDAVIVGAGLAGCAAALSLKQLDPNLSILVLERKTKETNLANGKQNPLRIGETVPAQIESLLSQLKLLKAFKDQNFKRSFGTGSAWGSPRLEQNEFIYSSAGYGYVVDRQRFDSFMQQQVMEAGVEIKFETSLYNSDYKNPYWKLQTLQADSLQHRMLEARFVIDASGRKAAFATQTGAVKIKQDQLIGLYTHLEFDSSTNKAGTLIESTAYGWWYSNFLNDGTAILALMTDADLVKELKLKESDHFFASLQATVHTKNRLNDFNTLQEPKLVAAHTQFLDKPAGGAWLAIGDAASCYDPLSSMGMFKSLQTAIYGSYAAFDWLNGNDQGIVKFDHLIKSAFKSYQHKKHEYYRLEKRFAGEPFWQRRELIA